MTGRSLKASPEGIKTANTALRRKSLNQTRLRERLELSRSTVSSFFRGIAIDYKNFCDICDELDLNWEDIVIKSLEENYEEIDELVQQVRAAVRDKIQERCGTMRILDREQDTGLGDIYTHVNILEKIIGRRRKTIDELLAECNLTDGFDRLGWGQIEEQRVSGLEAVEKYQKLMIWGKPGAGKTTFLKFLAVQCNRSEFYLHLVPIFVNLKDFAEAENRPKLLKYILKLFKFCLIKVNMGRPNALQTILEKGRALILLDGLDEVREEDSQRVIKSIRSFADNYSLNQFVVTCRIAAREYTFENFTEVEIADFDQQQIATFAKNWFKNKAIKVDDFIECLDKNKPIQELASNPLLLTLLCLVFEASGDFPANRAALYEEGLDALLKKWDAKRGIQRHNVYKKLSVGRKEDLLSKIAWTTFKKENYFFKQKVAEKFITDYLHNLPGASGDEEALQLDSEVVLHSIEAQHGLLMERAKGIYSFSHLTFHEYFTAREIVTVQQSSETALKTLMNHLTETRWREVFLLAVAMSPNADRLLLLMKKRADDLVAGDEKIQPFLTWLMEKARSVEVSYSQEAIEKIFSRLGFAPTFDLSLSRVLYLDLFLSFSHDRDLCATFFRSLNLSLDFSRDLSLDLSLYSSLSQALYHAQRLNRTLHEELQKLKEQLPDRENKEEFKRWWETNGKAWTEQLRAVTVKCRNIGRDWQFSNRQKKLLEQYWNANKLLMQCLNSECSVSREVYQQIEETLFLPIAKRSLKGIAQLPNRP